MNRLNHLKKRLASGVGLAVIAAAVSALYLPIIPAGADAIPENSAQNQKLSGSDLYAINCSRCHAERYPREFQPNQWATLITHMRVRANLPAAQAREILKYLQSEAGN